MARPIQTIVDERGVVESFSDAPSFQVLVGPTAQVSVGTLADLSGVKDSKMSTGAIAYVGSRKATFVLDRSYTLSALTGTIINTRSGNGKWVRSISPTSTWANQEVWFLDPVSGSDDADGSTSATPIKTLEELSWRFLFAYQGQNYLINILNDIPNDDKLVLSPISLPRKEGLSYLGSGQRGIITFQGVQTTRRTGSFTAASTSTSTSAQATITDSSVTWGADQDEMFHVTSGGSSGTTGWIDEDLGAGVCRVSSPATAAGTALAGGGFTGNYKIVTLTKWKCEGVVNGSLNGFLVRFKDIEFQAPNSGSLVLYSTNIASFVRCKFVGTTSLAMPLIPQTSYSSCLFKVSNATAAAPSTLQMFATAHSRVIMNGGCVFRSITFEPLYPTVAELNNDVLFTGGARIRMASTSSPSYGARLLCHGYLWFFNWAGISQADAAIVLRGEGSIMQVFTSIGGTFGTCTGSNTYGIRVENGAKYLLSSVAATPTLSGSLGEIMFEFGGAVIPVLTGSATPGAAQYVNSWATWAAAPFNSSIVSYTTFGAIRRLAL